MSVQGNYKEREFFYNKGNAEIFSEKNGKRTLAIEKEEDESSFLDDIGWNCVGEYVEMKVSKKSNSKYIYINAIVHTKEEGISSEDKRTIVLDGNGRYIKCQE